MFSNGKHLLTLWVFNIIARKTLLIFCRLDPEAALSLQQWYHDFLISEFKNFNEIKSKYGAASFLKDDRVVFNMMGNKYRLVVRILFEYKTVQIKWFGTHVESDKINVSTVHYKKRKK